MKAYLLLISNPSNKLAGAPRTPEDLGIRATYSKGLSRKKYQEHVEKTAKSSFFIS